MYTREQIRDLNFLVFWLKSLATIVCIKTPISVKKNYTIFFPSQIVADVETRRYTSSPYLGAGDNFWESYEENRMTGDLPYDSPYKKKSC
jgi:hypothetical protein